MTAIRRVSGKVTEDYAVQELGEGKFGEESEAHTAC